MNRREALEAAGLAVAGAALSPAARAVDPPAAKKVIALLVYPKFTALDLVGPHHVLSALDGYEVKLVWKTKDPVTSDTGLTLTPTATFADIPPDPAVLFAPGGTDGTLAAMKDPEVLDFLKSRGAKAGYVTSVCTGALVIGAAGLLRGYKATTHWAAKEVLPDLGAEPADGRVVRDRNRLTGGGVTAGIDFGLTLAAELKGEEFAKTVQMFMEYDPQPPFKAGTPAQAGEKIAAHGRAMAVRFVKNARAAAAEAKKTW